MELQLQEVIQAFLQAAFLKIYHLLNWSLLYAYIDQNLYSTKWEVIHHVVVKYYDRILNQFTKVHVTIVVFEQSFGLGFCPSISCQVPFLSVYYAHFSCDLLIMIIVANIY